MNELFKHGVYLSPGNYVTLGLATGDERLHCPADDSFLVKYLRARKYRVMETFEMIRNYFQARQRLQDYFSDLSPHTVPYRKIFVENRLILVSKLRDRKGRAIVVLKFGKFTQRFTHLAELSRTAPRASFSIAYVKKIALLRITTYLAC
ncbi:hypothetical protein HPB48_002361 [Haemaphysalis longicornis]|uniref:CRAL/TRIO N-terminal domain-containing protein n=1 Tax=Haemaphysalis longicornis TaxID=44386 RepID=A0A9J6GFI4_HAELO|nr:hypothetical protein HPB48_002361 [Haemaphysalis longicornis]